MTRPAAVIQLGAGPVQHGLLCEIAKRDLIPIVVDRAETPLGLTDESLHARAPIDEPEAILAAIEPLADRYECRAVLTSTDLGVASLPIVCELLGLPHASREAVAAMDDKVCARERLEAAGLSVPMRFSPKEVVDPAFHRSVREIVVKPVDSSGSRGVRRVVGVEAALQAIACARQFGDRVLVEACVEGEHLDVNGFVEGGRFSLVSIGRRFFSDPPYCVPVFGWIDRDSSAELEAQVQAAMQRAVDAFGYRHGAVKADLIRSDGEIVVLELAARFHGDVFSYHLTRATGRTPAAILWLAQLGLCEAELAATRRAGWFAVFADRAGKIRRIDGIDAFRSSPGFRAWIPRLGVGQEVGPPSDNRALVGFGVFCPDGHEDLSGVARSYRNAIHVSVD